MTSTEASAPLVGDGAYELAEGGRWFDGRYVYVDILGGRLFELRDDREGTGPDHQLAGLDVPLGAVARVHDRPGTRTAAADTGIAPLTPDGALDGRTAPRTAPPPPAG
ncbi:hypothetical protein [Streptomyces scabiei]|uniref:hypothetical protein n=1 Tax=Streptomyces scabiei TaxID=1930 RepID=UPI0029A7DFC1|nr:hypothetical protein [Streptomyces scabiei]MDX3517777.1 hypothetical protein [Streptomyces scabiei]